INRIASGHFPLVPSEFDMVKLVKEVIERFSEELAVLETELRLVADEPVPVFLDRYRIQQVLINLLSVSIVLSERRPIVVRLEGESSEVRVSINSGSRAISASDQQKIFERFEK